MIEQAVQKLLVADATLAAMVEGIYLAQRPQAYPLPAVVITRGSRQSLHGLKGPIGTDRGFVRVAALAGSYLSAADLAAQINQVLTGTIDRDMTVVDAQGDDRPLKLKYLIHNEQDDLPSEHRDGAGEIATHGIGIDFAYAITGSPESPTL